MSFAYYNGTFGKWEEIRLPLTDRCIFFADGVYDAAIGRRGKIYLCREHIERFLGNCCVMGLPAPSYEELERLLYKTVSMSGIESYFLYFQISGYAEERRHAPRSNQNSNLLITVTPYTLPEHTRELKLISYPDRRQSFCNIKTLNLLGSLLAAEAAHAQDADEAVFVRDGYVTECSHSNISILKNGTLITHPLTEKILPGISRKCLISAARAMAVPVLEEPFSLSELYSADDVLVSSTGKLALRANELDGAPISSGKREIGDAIMAQMFKEFEKSC